MAVKIKPPDLPYIVESLRPLAVPIEQLLQDPRNARRHPESNLEAIKGSLAQYGQLKPIVCNRLTGHIEAGNGTLEAALGLGWSHLAVVYVEHDPETATGFALADNRTSDLSDFDVGRLEAALKEMEATELDPRLDEMLKDLGAEYGAGRLAPEPEPKEIQLKPPPEMVWLLLGIPLDQFGDVQHHVAALQEVSGVTVQSNRD
jgi:ParB-like nuclease domain